MSTSRLSSSLSCGIDFGTSNSTVAISNGKGSAKLVPTENGLPTLPSAVFFHHTGKQPIFGRSAINAYLDGEDGRLMRGLKKVLGTPLMDDKTVIQGRVVGFSDILAIYIKYLKDQAELHAGSEIRNVVLGRPVHFHDNRPDLDDRSAEVIETIARQVGFEEVHFQLEPIAAAFAHEANFDDEKLSLVIDLGGGTSDFTIMRLSCRYMNKPERKQDILATAGVRVGGTTFDYRLSTKYFMPQLGLGSEYKGEFDASKILTVPSTVFAEMSDWHLVHRTHTEKAIQE
ncbi:MAG: Hsp70 family protein, partial [Alphaproteobacteria bacterium]